MNETVVWTAGWFCALVILIAMSFLTSRCQIEEQHDVTKRIEAACQGDLAIASRSAVCAAAITKGEKQ